MSRVSFSTIINSKNFYRDNLRHLNKFVLLSVFITVCMLIAIYYIIKSRSDAEYYASDGIQAPVKLQPLNEPNYSSEPLIESEELEKTDEALLDLKQENINDL